MFCGKWTIILGCVFQPVFNLFPFLLELFIINGVFRMWLRKIQKNSLRLRRNGLQLSRGGLLFWGRRPLYICRKFVRVIAIFVTVSPKFSRLLYGLWLEINHRRRNRAFLNTSRDYVGWFDPTLRLLIILRYIINIQHKQSRLISFVLGKGWPSSVSRCRMKLFGEISLSIFIIICFLVSCACFPCLILLL